MMLEWFTLDSQKKVVVHNDANAKMLLKKSFNMVVMETEVKGMPS